MSFNKKPVVQNIKQIHDSIHGYISLSNLMVWVIDSIPFQRLRKLKQLGCCYLVFHNAVHTRHEHSIGTAHLAGKLMDTLNATTDPLDIDEYLASIAELKPYYDRTYRGKIHVLDEYIIELVKIAALCHDLGHGPFSHVFDDYFLPLIKKDSEDCDKHEYRSCVLLEMIIKEHKKLSKIIGDGEIQFMKNLIHPTKDHTGFIYQIVSNTLNGLDVDKYDYIQRDSYVTGTPSSFKADRLIGQARIINNNICYPEQAIGDIVELFQTRYKLHKTVYCHKAVISAQYMIIEVMKHLDKAIQLSESVRDMIKFIKCTDEYVLNCHHMLKSDYCKLPEQIETSVNKACNIILKIDSHQLYPHVDTYVSNERIDISRKHFTAGSVNDILIYRNVIGYVSGRKSNPLNDIYVFKTKDLANSDKLTSRKVQITDYSLMLPANHQEHITMIFYRRSSQETINAIKNEFRYLVTNPNAILEREKQLEKDKQEKHDKQDKQDKQDKKKRFFKSGFDLDEMTNSESIL